MRSCTVHSSDSTNFIIDITQFFIGCTIITQYITTVHSLVHSLPLLASLRLRELPSDVELLFDQPRPTAARLIADGAITPITSSSITDFCTVSTFAWPAASFTTVAMPRLRKLSWLLLPHDDGAQIARALQSLTQLTNLVLVLSMCIYLVSHVMYHDKFVLGIAHRRCNE